MNKTEIEVLSEEVKTKLKDFCDDLREIARLIVTVEEQNIHGRIFSMNVIVYSDEHGFIPSSVLRKILELGGSMPYVALRNGTIALSTMFQWEGDEA